MMWGVVGFIEKENFAMTMTAMIYFLAGTSLAGTSSAMD